MVRKRYRLSLYVISILFILNCQQITTKPILDDLPPLLNEKAAVFASMDGDDTGILLLNANTLDSIGNINTTPHVAFQIVFSPDDKKLYAAWRYSNGIDNYLHEIDIPNLSIVKKVLIPSNVGLVSSYHNEYLINYTEGFTIYDRNTLSLIYTDSSIDIITKIVSSNKSNLFFTLSSWYYLDQPYILVYDADSFSAIDTIKVFDPGKYPGLGLHDAVLSLDEKSLYVSGYSLYFGGKFFEIDIKSKRIVFEHSIGSLSQLAMSPDGEDIYISDPAGYLHPLIPTNKVLDYDTKNRFIKTFLTPSILGLKYNSLITDKIIVASDNRTIFISSPGIPLEEDLWVQIIKVDRYSGKMFGYYSIPTDSLGRIHGLVRNIALGSY